MSDIKKASAKGNPPTIFKQLKSKPSKEEDLYIPSKWDYDEFNNSLRKNIKI